ncbi:hypothetical protein ABTQ33_11320 [Paucilactobacillus suebicus]|uniref:Uncharacterized protein n=1 Tax=Paucilactobacillus suebicus DSM 5007 = KCTC 3549 TaxID=1423807 RepID=A0A0R1VXS9_9LACO|nr:hypothetical protein FD16_GL001198 [Paucilactobacillus suebicus DSM 5007 = KCTC 3549]
MIPEFGIVLRSGLSGMICLAQHVSNQSAEQSGFRSTFQNQSAEKAEKGVSINRIMIIIPGIGMIVIMLLSGAHWLSEHVSVGK